MYFIVLVGIHSVLCIVLIGLVLLQQGKGADAGVTIGGGGNSLFGAAGSADFITKLTTALAIGFMVTSVLMIRAYQEGGASVFARTESGRDLLGGSVMKELVQEEGAPQDSAVAVVESTEAVVEEAVAEEAVVEEAVVEEVAAEEDAQVEESTTKSPE